MDLHNLYPPLQEVAPYNQQAAHFRRYQMKMLHLEVARYNQQVVLHYQEVARYNQGEFLHQ